MDTSDTAPEADHLIVEQDTFCGERFWAGLERLADRHGHGDHPRMLHGTTERTDWYAYRCVSCERPIATMQVRRKPG